ncbi:MAG: transferase [candidate division WOR-3 bacterium]|nr:MAG: transferase [candidate division WOR-3 bacterium]
MSLSYRIHPNVALGTKISIGDFCIIGEPPTIAGTGRLETTIGDNATIRSHTIIYSGNSIGRDFQTGNHVNIRESNLIGDRVSVGTISAVEHHATIEDDVRIHTRAFIPEFCILKRGCWVGPGVILTNTRCPGSERSKEHLEGVVVGEGATVGAGATILPGVKIGSGALVGAGSVVSKDVPPNAVVVGNPARRIADVGDLRFADGGLVYP